MCESKAWCCLKIEVKKKHQLPNGKYSLLQRQTCHNDNNDNNHDDMSRDTERKEQNKDKKG